MIVGLDNPVANYSSIQSSATETLRVSLSPDMVRELDLPEGMTVKGAVAEDGKSVTLNTENGRVQIKGNFARSAGEVVDVEISSPHTPQAGELEQPGKPQISGPTSDKELDEIFEGASEKIDQSPEFNKLKQELKNEIDWGGTGLSGEIDVLQGSPVHIDFQKVELKDSRASVWEEAPEARETKLGENSVDFTDGEINSGEDEWGGFGDTAIPDLEGWVININHELSNGDHVWLTGRVETDNHARFSMWFDNSGTAAYALQNINSIQAKIESLGMVVDHLGISPFSKDKIDNPPKSTFMIEV